MSTWRVGPAVGGTTEVEVGGRLHVYSPVTQQLVALNDTAGDVWRLCDGEHTEDGIVELLARGYDTAPEAIREDVRATLDRFVHLALLPDPPVEQR